ncbi:MAG: hypothetical protein Q6373_020250 [Candidatus Sigynarchaeota archaeon]
MQGELVPGHVGLGAQVLEGLSRLSRVGRDDDLPEAHGQARLVPEDAVKVVDEEIQGNVSRQARCTRSMVTMQHPPKKENLLIGALGRNIN